MISTFGVAAGLDALRRRLGDRAHLQGEEAGHDEPETHAAQAEHRVGLVQALDGGEQRELLGVRVALARARRATRTESSVKFGQELVQRRVEQPDRDRAARPSPRAARTKSSRCSGSSAASASSRSSPDVGEDHALDEHPAVAEEHVLGAGQADALRAEVAGAGGVLGGVGVGAHAQPAGVVGVREQPVDGADQQRGLLVGVGDRVVDAVLEVGHDRATA